MTEGTGERRTQEWARKAGTPRPVAAAPAPPDETLLGLFDRAEQAVVAVDTLQAAGVEPRQLTVLSGTPYPEGAFGEESERHSVYTFTFVGAACGFIVGVLLTVGTQLSFPLVTGGKPILSLPPMINVLFEGTMLGAIIFSVVGIIREAHLPDYRSHLYDPRISEGCVGIVVRHLDGQVDDVERALHDAGAIDIVRRSRLSHTDATRTPRHRRTR